MTINTTIAAMKTALQSINPTPQSAPAAVYAFPADIDSIAYNNDMVFEAMPEAVIVVSEYIAGEQVVSRVGAVDVLTWEMEILIFLAPGFYKDAHAAAAVAALMPGWLEGYNAVLRANKRLGGEIIAFGNVDGTGQLFRVPRKGHMSWNGKEYWGIPILQPVSTVIT